MNNNICFICNSSLSKENIKEIEGVHGVYKISCEICGIYEIGINTIQSMEENKEIEEKRYILSGILRNSYENGVIQKLLYNGLIELLNFINSAELPKDNFDKINIILLYIFNKQTSADELVSVNSKIDYPIIYAKNRNEFEYLLDDIAVNNFNYLERFGAQELPQYRLTPNGWNKINELNKEIPITNKAFVAMWFDKQTDEIYNGIEEILIKTHFDKPFRIDKCEHNNDINDEILSRIRKSSLLIADFTGDRGGVYFETGFAKGLNIPVIFTCRKDWFKTDVFKRVTSKETTIYENNEKTLHFDIEHMNFIQWSTIEDLKNELLNRIESTIPGHLENN